MTDERAFHFHCSDAMAGNIDHGVDSPHDPEVAVFVASSAVTGEVQTRNVTPVLAFETFRISVNRAHHRGPGPSHTEKATLICTDRVALTVHNIRNDSGKRPSRGAGLR